MCEVACSEGVDAWLEDVDGKTAYEWATEAERPGVVEYLDSLRETTVRLGQ